MDTPIPVDGSVVAGEWPVDGPDIWWTTEADNKAYGSSTQQWSDGSDTTYGTAIWHGYYDAQFTGVSTGLACLVAPAPTVDHRVESLTITVRARLRPESPSAVLPGGTPPYLLTVSLRNRAGELAASADFHFPLSWDPADQQTVALPTVGQLHLGAALAEGATVLVDVYGDQSLTTYSEVWADVYEVSITAHGGEVGLASAVTKAHFKGTRR